jgi:hypothetical protein
LTSLALRARHALYFRADAAFAKPEIHELLKAEYIGYTIYLPANSVLVARNRSDPDPPLAYGPVASSTRDLPSAMGLD